MHLIWRYWWHFIWSLWHHIVMSCITFLWQFIYNQPFTLKKGIKSETSLKKKTFELYWFYIPIEPRHEISNNIWYVRLAKAQTKSDQSLS